MVRKFKCGICKILIDDNLHEINHMTKSGREIKKRYHKCCYEKQQLDIAEKDNFYKYISDNFFNISIPQRFFHLMADIKCSYKNILDCCQKIDLVNIISGKTFQNDRVKVVYIIEVIKSNINKYMQDKTEQINQSDNVIDVFIERNNTNVRGNRAKLYTYDDFKGEDYD